jgi:hypothetical protein
MTKEYIIHGHGSVQDPFGRLLEPFHAGKSSITFFTNYGSCATVNKRKLSIASGMRYDDPVHYITKASNLSQRVIESRTGIPLFTQNEWVPDLWIDMSPSNLQMVGLYEVKPDGLQTVHLTRHERSFMLLSNIVNRLGPAHFHVLSCRAAAHPISHKNANVLQFAINKNRKSTSRRKRNLKSNKNENIPVSLAQLQTRSMRYFRQNSKAK